MARPLGQWAGRPRPAAPGIGGRAPLFFGAKSKAKARPGSRAPSTGRAGRSRVFV